MNEDPLEELLKLKSGGSKDPLEELMASKSGGITPGHSKFTPEQLIARADRSVAQSEDELEAAGGYNPTTHKIIGTAASLAREVPGVEAVQALVASKSGGLPYRDALRTVREVESDAGKAGTIARIGGGAVAAMAFPGQGALSPVMQGARYGMLSGLTQADPATVEDRVHDAAIGGTVGALTAGIAPKVPGALARVAKGAAANVRNTADLALTPFSHGARMRTVGRLAGLAREAMETGAKPPASAAAPMVEGYRPIGEMIERAPARVLPFRAPAAGTVAEAPAAASVAPQNAKAQLSALLQKNLDEGMEAAESVKGYPISGDPPSNVALMRRIEEALLRAKRGGVAARATPRKGITTPPRTVADVLKGGRQ